MLQNHEVLGFIQGDSDRISVAISTGAAWEIWMQVELALLFRGRNFGTARELSYPPPNQNLRLDLGVQDREGNRYAIELKVESATNAVRGFFGALFADVNKIKLYNVDNLAARWVVGIAFSDQAKNLLAQLTQANPNTIIFGHSNAIGVVIIDGSSFVPPNIDWIEAMPDELDSPEELIAEIFLEETSPAKKTVAGRRRQSANPD